MDIVIYLDTLLVRKISKGHFLKGIENSSFGQFAQFWPTGGHWLQQICSHSSITQTKIKISSWNFEHLFIMCLCKFDKKNLAIAQSACQLRPISAKTLEVSSDSICWDIWKRKEMVRFWTYLSNLLEGIVNTTQFITMIAIKKKIWGTSDMIFRAYTYVEYHIERQFQNFTREFWEKCKSSKLYYIKYINLLIWTTSSTFLNSSFCVCISNFMEKTLA